MPATYFASDTHLRPDRPDRGRRLARLVERIRPGEELFLVGDICDFWFASRRRAGDERRCPGLVALADLTRRGGRLSILTGNHDAWLGPFYREFLGARLIADPILTMTLHGLRLHVAHGHLLQRDRWWKGAMEGELFLRAFRTLPGPIAAVLATMLENSNEAHRPRDEALLLASFRDYADGLADVADVVILGHLHRAVDDPSRVPRLIVLGDWIHKGSFLRIDESGARLVFDLEGARVALAAPGTDPITLTEDGS